MNSKQQYDEYFNHAYRDKKGADFEAWFVKMASLVWGDDFENIKAGGESGDKKSDGRKISEEIIFQCYAPESPSTFAAKAVSKIADSFPDVTRYWLNIKKWVFVHNNIGGETASLSNELEKLRKKYPKLEVKTWGRECLKKELHDKLSLRDLDDVYPKAREKIEPLKLEHIRPLIDKIIKKSGDKLGFEKPLGVIPKLDKIDFNEFSEPSKNIIKQGWIHVKIVQDYIDNFSEPKNASKLQKAMSNKYKELKDYRYNSDDLLNEMINWIVINQTGSERAAAAVIVAHFFETCDIFENAPEG